VLTQPDVATGLAARGLAWVQRRHTCAHRVDEGMAIVHCISARPLVTA
jgi:hypothetical protein